MLLVSEIVCLNSLHFQEVNIGKQQQQHSSSGGIGSYYEVYSHGNKLFTRNALGECAYESQAVAAAAVVTAVTVNKQLPTPE